MDLLAYFWPGTLKNESGAIVRYEHVISSAFNGFRCKWMVTLCQPSSSENKQRSLGVHTTKLYSKGVGQGNKRSQLPAACLSSKTHPPFFSVRLSISVSYSFITQKASQTERQETAEF